LAELSTVSYHDIITSEASVIETSKPALVAQYSLGQMMDGVLSDPFMMLIPPVEQFLNKYIFATPESGFDYHFINIVLPTSQAQSFRLNGEDYSEYFTPIGNTAYSGAQIEVLPGSHSVNSSVPFGLYVYGFANADSYGYPGGMSTEVINPINGDYKNVRVTSRLYTDNVELDLSSFVV